MQLIVAQSGDAVAGGLEIIQQNTSAPTTFESSAASTVGQGRLGVLLRRSTTGPGTARQARVALPLADFRKS
jgi:hypothetical protein